MGAQKQTLGADNNSLSPQEIIVTIGVPTLHHSTMAPSHPFGQWPLPIRPLHGYWDSPEISSAFPLMCL